MVFRLKARQVVSFILLLLLVVAAQTVFTPEQVQAVMAAEQPKSVRVPVIMYHHLLYEKKCLDEWTITPDQFEKDLQYLKEKGYTSMLISELIEALEGNREMPEKPVILTFDDGRESFFAYAFPLLQKYDMKAVVSVVGLYSDAFSETGEQNVTYGYLLWDQIAELAKSGIVEFGNHSYELHSTDKRMGCRIMN